MTDVNNSIEYQSASLGDDDHDAKNNSFVLNESRIPMDVDVDDEEIRESTLLKTNGHRSPSASSYTIENGNHNELEKEDVFHLGNPVLNKSFDVLPQIKDDDTPSADAILDDSPKSNNALDTTVELPNATDEFNEKSLQDRYGRKSVNHITTPTNTQSLLSNQFSVEYPYVIPPPQKNTRPSSPDSVEPLMSLTKNMKLNINKMTSEGQDPSPSTTDKTFDTNTFVLKKKDRRKVTTPVTDSSFNATIEDTPPDLCNKQSPFNTPSTSINTAATPVPRPVAVASSTIQQPLTDPTRIM